MWKIIFYIKENLDEIKVVLREIVKSEQDNEVKLGRDYERLNETDKKVKSLIDRVNISDKDIAEIKGRLA